MTTAARVHSSDSSHWYYTDGRPCYELPKADGKGMKSPTLADARKLNLVPGVSTILKTLAKPELQAWLIEQAVLAVMTTPRQPGEADDAFIKRVLSDERQQEGEAARARDLGTQIHAALEDLFNGKAKDVADVGELAAYVGPAYEWMRANVGAVIGNETILSGEGYAGRTDIITARLGDSILWDFKSAKKLPDIKKGGWNEHRLQLAAYCAAWSRMRGIPNVRAGNVYISTTEPGKFVVCEYTQADMTDAFNRGFQPLLTIWQYLNKYQPTYS